MTRVRALSVVPLVLAALWVACDNRACLAQSELFDGYRPELIEECCLCLARRGTAAPGASCGEAQLTLDGGVIADGGTAIPSDPEFVRDDNDDVIDDDELPCLCSDDAKTCAAKLGAGQSLRVTGACVSQGTELFVTAPCEVECRDVLTFDSPVLVDP